MHTYCHFYSRSHIAYSLHVYDLTFVSAVGGEHDGAEREGCWASDCRLCYNFVWSVEPLAIFDEEPQCFTVSHHWTLCIYVTCNQCQCYLIFNCCVNTSIFFTLHCLHCHCLQSQQSASLISMQWVEDATWFFFISFLVELVFSFFLSSSLLLLVSDLPNETKKYRLSHKEMVNFGISVN